MNKIKSAVSVTTALIFMMMNQKMVAIQDSTHILKAVEVKSQKPNFDKANYLNDVFSANSLQSQWSDMYIKNYGLGQLSTFSVRGLSSENVAIVWENIPINSPMNGLFDLNLIPNSLLQNISHNMNDNRLTTGGYLSLSQSKSLDNMIAISSTAYLSSLFSHKIDGHFNFKKSNLSIINQFTHGVNNFEFIDGMGLRNRLDNNAVNQINTQIFYNYNLGPFVLNTGFWYQNQDRAIPISEFYPVTTQSLMDRNYRVFAGISNEKVELKLSYMNESQQYDDQNILFPYSSTHKVQSVKGVVKYSPELNTKLKLNYILYPSYYQINSTSFDTSKTIAEAIQQIHLQYALSAKWALDAGIKSQINTNFNSFLLPYISASYQIRENFSVAIIADINQRTPTANELYYNPGGNINLKPETNYQVRNNWKYKYSNAVDKVQLSAEPYYIKSIDNIKWLPDSNFIFSPTNIASVTSIGFNSNIEWIRKIYSSHHLRTIISLNYIDSKSDLDLNTIYVPNLKAILTLNWINPNYEVLMQNNYTSQRYVDASNTNALKPYLLTNVKGTYKLNHPKSQLNFSIGIDNLWNENYQEIQGSYMPIRNYYINFTAILR